jgi:hypothetical protein
MENVYGRYTGLSVSLAVLKTNTNERKGRGIAGYFGVWGQK